MGKSRHTRVRPRTGLFPGSRVRQGPGERLRGMQDESLELEPDESYTHAVPGQIIGYRPRKKFSVPNFSIVRPLVKTDELKEFHEKLSEKVNGGAYKVRDLDSLAVHILPRRDVVRAFHQADVQPTAQRMLRAIEMSRLGLRSALQHTPREIPFETGEVGFLTSDPRIMSVGPYNWSWVDGPERLDDGSSQKSSNFHLTFEANQVIGSLANTFSSGNDRAGNTVSIPFDPIRGLTPHIPLIVPTGKKTYKRGDAERHADFISRNIPPQLTVFDPVIDIDFSPIDMSDLSLNNGLPIPAILHVRSMRGRDPGDLTVFPSAA